MVHELDGSIVVNINSFDQDFKFVVRQDGSTPLQPTPKLFVRQLLTGENLSGSL